MNVNIELSEEQTKMVEKLVSDSLNDKLKDKSFINKLVESKVEEIVLDYLMDYDIWSNDDLIQSIDKEVSKLGKEVVNNKKDNVIKEFEQQLVDNIKESIQESVEMWSRQ